MVLDEEEISVALPGGNVKDHITRWSESYVSLPAVIVTPKTEADIQLSLQYALDNGLRVVDAGGGHGSFVPVTAKTLYLKTEQFKSIDVDETASTVTIGGGVLTGELFTALTTRSFYTMLPNSHAMGVVGAVLGTGNNPFNSLHGLMADNINGARIVTAKDGKISSHDITGTSTNSEECALLSAISGAGLGVIVSMQLKIFRVADLSLDNGNHIWQRRVIYPGFAIRDAAELFVSLLPVQGPAAAVMLFARSPPNSPRPGSPIVIVIGSYYGPAAVAEQLAFAKAIQSPDLAAKSVVAVTEGAPLTTINDATVPFNAVSGSKNIDGTFLHGIDAERIVDLFGQYVSYTEGQPERHMSYTVISAWDKTKAEELGNTAERKDNFVVSRGRSVLQVNTTWSTKVDTASEEAARTFMLKMKEIATRGETGPEIGFPNGLAFPATLCDYYPKNKVEELQAIKALRDPKGLFWSPAMGAQ
ncbi:hypothetical protein SCUCBS95973_008807 [Sporothrix curviconia]|uniref:FAD-binding PCMH-type domain-containing protein n=1 Tax=Sporothrix curviconia TaxID=1260050 RepID=A0ABP0CQH3_9PEZI